MHEDGTDQNDLCQSDAHQKEGLQRMWNRLNVAQCQSQGSHHQEPDPRCEILLVACRVCVILCHKTPQSEQIKECENEYPYHIDEMPVQAGIFDLVCRVFSHGGPERHNCQDRHPAKDVETVEAGDYEE